MATVTSKQFTLNTRDIIRGIIMAVAVPVVTIITQSLDAGNLTFNWKAIAIAALSGFFGYLVKNFLSPTEITIVPASKEEAEQVKSGDAEVKVVPK